MSEKVLNPVGWFEIPVTDMARAKTFYEKVFGFKLVDNEDLGFKMAFFPAHMDVPGAPGSLVMADAETPPGHGTVVYFTAPDIDAHLGRARAQGGEVVMEKTAIGEWGFIGMIKDTEGNVIGLHSRIG